MYVCMYVCMYVYIYIRRHTYTYMFICLKLGTWTLRGAIPAAASGL